MSLSIACLWNISQRWMFELRTVLCNTHKGDAMPNKKQLSLLRAGVDEWNKWRERQPDEKIDLREADLTGANLSEALLVKADFSRANLWEANLSRSYLLLANLSGADLRQANVSMAFLNGANLSGADLRKANLSGANLIAAHLSEADLREAYFLEARFFEADLRNANLSRAFLNGADLNGADLRKANLSGADLSNARLHKAKLSGADLWEATLSGADLSEANLSRANLSAANLSSSNLIGANINNTKISKSIVYGVNIWDLVGKFKEQNDLIITPEGQPSITVDNIKVAQFVYLILNNKEIRDVINTLTSKTVLILGRFAIPERKAILDRLRDKLREYDLLPIVFDFDRPTDKDFTETIKTLAGISYFVIADVTNPKSSPLELQATVPDYQIPFVPIIQEGEYPFAMMVDLQKKYNWVLDTISYDSLDTLIEILKPHIIDPAIKKRDELRLIKAKEPTIISGRDLRDKKKQGKL